MNISSNNHACTQSQKDQTQNSEGDKRHQRQGCSASLFCWIDLFFQERLMWSFSDCLCPNAELSGGPKTYPLKAAPLLPVRWSVWLNHYHQVGIENSAWENSKTKPPMNVAWLQAVSQMLKSDFLQNDGIKIPVIKFIKRSADKSVIFQVVTFVKKYSYFLRAKPSGIPRR